MRENFRSRHQPAKKTLKPQHGLEPKLKLRANGIFCNAIRSKTISKLPGGKVSTISPAKSTWLCASSKQCHFFRLDVSQKSATFSRHLTSNKLADIRKQLSSYEKGAYIVIAKARLLQLAKYLRPTKQSQSKQHKSESCSAMSVKEPENLKPNTRKRTPMVSSATLRKTPEDATRNTLQSKKDIDVLHNSFRELQNAALIPFLNAPVDIDFNNVSCYSPVDRNSHRKDTGKGSQRTRQISDFKPESQHLYFNDLDSFKWHPRSPDNYWQPTTLL